MAALADGDRMQIDLLKRREFIRLLGGITTPAVIPCPTPLRRDASTGAPAGHSEREAIIYCLQRRGGKS
jgi:hypothetical protein